MTSALISVIMPVYNLADYLPKSIDSILAQTYSNFELIVVDDGSTDNSAAVLKKYAEKDGRIKPLFKENGGVSSARNLGLDHAAGAYIYFLDGDDWISPDALEKLYRISDGFDIVGGAYVETHEDGSQSAPPDIKFVDLEITDRSEMLSCYFTTQIQESSCNKLYQKAVIGNIRFNESFAVAEDSQFVYEVLKQSKKVKMIPDVTYYYYTRNDSCMHSAFSEKKFAIMTLRDQQYQEVKDDQKLFRKFIFRYAKDIFYLLHGILHDNSKKFYNRIPELRKKLLKEKTLIFQTPELNLHFKLGVLLLWLFPSLFYKLYSK